MTSLTHASAGALAGAFIPNPIFAFLVGVVIHFLMDKIPHFWPEDRKSKGIIIVADTVLSSVFILGLYLFPETRNASVIAGALGGVSVDFYFVLIMRSRGKLAEWHTNRQPHKTERLWVASDLAIFGSAVALIWLALW